jgi:valyl-tRNA synthetase
VGLVDAAHEKNRIERSTKKIDKDIESIERRLANKAFLEKAPPEVVVEAREQLEALRRQKAALEAGLSLVDELG